MSGDTVAVEIKNRWTGEVLFTAQVEAGLNEGRRLGAAVKLAIKAHANLAGANLVGAYLVGANLVGAYLAGTNLAAANLATANLARANLAKANLAHANLAAANLATANLAHANLAAANLATANLARANLALDCGTPHGWRVVVVSHADGIRVAAGCRWFTFSAAVEHWRNREGRELMPPLLAYIEAAVKAKGWKL